MSVVAVGASAGGLEAFQRLLTNLPTDTNMAFVMILHLSPTHESALADILGRSARMPVRNIEHGMELEPNHIYVALPRSNVLLANDHFELAPRAEFRGVPHPIDHFMRSLAEGLGERAIGVVLSGTGDDGSLGVTDIKAAGGITFAQDDSAQQATMPHNAVASGGIDFVLAPEAIAQELVRIAAHPFVHAQKPPPPADGGAEEKALHQLFELLSREKGIAFNNYRRNTINRRILRRMALHRIESLSEYVQFASSRPREIEALFHDILINVTNFFRDPAAFEEVKRIVFPQITQNKGPADAVRVWVPGCSTGQDAYSVAMSYVEFCEANAIRSPMQVFATDANARAIQSARAGIYSKGIELDVSPERLRAFFTNVDGSYRVSKAIRDMCVFAHHDVLSEPPFSRVDLIVCRNLLIYFEPVLQRKLLPTLQYALNPGGYLWLGSSETVGTLTDLFEDVDNKHRIYRRKAGMKRHVELQPGSPGRRPEPPLGPPRPAIGRDPQRDAERQLLARYAPPAVVVDMDLNVVQFRGDTSPYLTPPQGRASLNLYKMLREGLLVGVRGAIHRARRENKPIREESLRITTDGIERDVTIVAIPVGTHDEITSTIIVFEEPGEGGAAQARQTLGEKRTDNASKPRPEAPGEEAQRLRHELAATREYLQAVVEQLETANAELQASNEEAQSSNEELQSVNEELETSKEEIQSTNEELTTVNEELQNSNLELTQSNNDLANLLGSVQIPVVMLDQNLRIRVFTPPAESLMNLRGSDIGRPYSDIKPNLDVSDMDDILRQVLAGAVVEREIRDREGRWFWLRVRPYRASGKGIQGAIVIVIDIDTIKRTGQRLDESEDRFADLKEAEEGLRNADRAKDEFLATLGHELRNPLAAISHAAFVLATRNAGGRPREIEVIERQTRNMIRIVDDLLDVSRITHGKVSLRPDPVDLNATAHDAIAATEHDRQRLGQTIDASLPADPPWVLADRARIEQILTNLLGNASKFAPIGGRIALSITSERIDETRGWATIRVSDNGPGIEASVLPRAFELFVQGNRVDDRARSGVGIGLALARHLVSLHGGTIEAHNLQVGTELVVRLPLIAPPISSPRSGGPGNQPAPSRRVLVVDDNADAAHAVGTVLELYGHRVRVAGNGREAIQAALDFKPQAILLDIGLPDLDGYTVARQLREDERTRHIALIALSGYGREEDEARAREAGFDLHLKKPAEPDALSRAIGATTGPA